MTVCVPIWHTYKPKARNLECCLSEKYREQQGRAKAPTVTRIYLHMPAVSRRRLYLLSFHCFKMDINILAGKWEDFKWVKIQTEIFIIWYVFCVSASTLVCMYARKGQKKFAGVSSLLSLCGWVGTKLRLSGLVAGAFTQWAQSKKPPHYNLVLAN